jgi:hypothetical protein
MNTINRIFLCALAPAILVSCGAPQELSETNASPIAPKKIAEFQMANWYPACVAGSGCWHDFKNDEGSWSLQFQVSYDQGDYNAKTNGALIFVCNNGRTANQNIDSSIAPGWKSAWFTNPCPGKLTKITMRAGLDGTWGAGTLTYWQKWL